MEKNAIKSCDFPSAKQLISRKSIEQLGKIKKKFVRIHQSIKIGKIADSWLRRKSIYEIATKLIQVRHLKVRVIYAILESEKPINF